ncbi:radical SAM protein, partial [Patescibacteria group bacterium]|nr:radical SAM protein [Patescibacteria group bacterium]
KENLLKELQKHKLCFSLGERSDLEDYIQIQKGLECKKIGILYLLATDACNLACRYCFIEGELPPNYQFTKMTSETVRFGIDLFAKALSKSHDIEEPQVILYGGEPLMNLVAVKEAINYIKQLKQQGNLAGNTSITLNTNGTLINQEVVNVLKQAENLNVAISLDGSKDVNDKCRFYHSKSGTYNDIMKAYYLLTDNGIGVGFCCTINKFNIDELEKISKWFVEDLQASSVGFNMLIESCNIDEVRGDAQVYAEKTAQKIIDCFKYFREKGVYEDRVMRKVNAFVDGYIYYHDCGGCGQQLVISPDGMVGVCQGYCANKKYFIKPDNNFDPLSHFTWDLWRHRSPLFMPQCRDCIALSICGGGCPFSADERNGSIWELDDIFCVHAKKTTEFLIKDLISQTVK